MANKKITDLTDIQNSLSLSAQVEIAQSGSFRATMQKILDLFRANATATASNVGFIELATQTETNTGTDDTRAITPLKLASSSKWDTKEDVFNPANTDTGPYTVNIDAMSGVCVFTDVAHKNNVTMFELINSNIESDTLISYDLKYNGAGAPVIMRYETFSGSSRIHVANLQLTGHNADTNQNLTISFRILA